jgi:hypothetical protein
LVLQTGKALFAKSSPPLPDDLRAHPKPSGDLGVRQTLGGVQHDLRALHIAIRQRQPRRPPLKLKALLLVERDLHRRRHRQRNSSPAL